MTSVFSPTAAIPPIITATTHAAALAAISGLSEASAPLLGGPIGEWLADNDLMGTAQTSDAVITVTIQALLVGDDETVAQAAASARRILAQTDAPVVAVAARLEGLRGFEGPEDALDSIAALTEDCARALGRNMDSLDEWSIPATIYGADQIFFTQDLDSVEDTAHALIDHVDSLMGQDRMGPGIPTARLALIEGLAPNVKDAYVALGEREAERELTSL